MIPDDYHWIILGNPASTDPCNLTTCFESSFPGQHARPHWSRTSQIFSSRKRGACLMYRWLSAPSAPCLPELGQDPIDDAPAGPAGVFRSQLLTFHVTPPPSSAPFLPSNWDRSMGASHGKQHSSRASSPTGRLTDLFALPESRGEPDFDDVQKPSPLQVFLRANRSESSGAATLADRSEQVRYMCFAVRRVLNLHSVLASLSMPRQH